MEEKRRREEWKKREREGEMDKEERSKKGGENEGENDEENRDRKIGDEIVAR